MNSNPNGYFSAEDVPGIFVKNLRFGGVSPIHQHDFYELILVLSGKGFHIEEEHEFAVGRGNVFLTLPGMIHGSRNCTDMKAACIMFQPERLLFSLEALRDLPAYQTFFQTAPKLSASFRFKNNFLLPPPVLNELAGLVQQMDAEQKRNASGWKFALSALFMNFLAILLRGIPENGRDTEVLFQLNRILRALKANHGKDVTVETIAKTFGLSRRSLERLFRDSLGSSPNEYLNDLRLESALDLLARSEFRITGIAERCGFPDNCYFSRCFRKKYGKSPRDWRKECDDARRFTSS